jgi:ATP-dependent Clp protease ATP-binding subunit ClpA
MEANAVYPEHLLLGVIVQGESKAARQLCFAGMDMPALRMRATEIFGSHYTIAPASELAFASEVHDCLRQSIVLAEQAKAPLVLPEHVVLSVLKDQRNLVKNAPPPGAETNKKRPRSFQLL